jgi:2-succinyl-5-enolpyruvyl-6-hydroxy-3-cyclohexene-1-carboxylate synthase
VGVLSQRGASGIDGLLSGALGAALASARPTALLLGDISLLHDLSALGLPAVAELESPLLVVVLNNDGGRIFDHLPMAQVAGLEAEQRALWTTPHGRNFEHAARMFDVPWTLIEAGGDCRDALSAAWARPGLSLVEVTVPCDASVRLESQLRARFDAGFEAATEEGSQSIGSASSAEGHARHD